MKHRIFIHENGITKSQFPFGSNTAKELEYAVYATIAGCGVCGQEGYTTFYVRDDKCLGCLQKEMGDYFSDPGPHNPPLSKAASEERGLEWYFNGKICMDLPHPKAAHLTTGKCVHCHGERKSPERKAAQEGGHERFASHFPCAECGLRLRWTSTARCTKCRPREVVKVSAERQIMKDAPDMILSRSMAVSMGLGVYRTGKPCNRGHMAWRRVKGQACIDCKEGRA